jgi:transketolase N-terminal domain/subunit
VLRRFGLGGGPVRVPQSTIAPGGPVDVNGLGQSGVTPYRHRAEVFVERFAAFGWKTRVINGHDIPEILEALQAAEQDGPTARP